MEEEAGTRKHEMMRTMEIINFLPDAAFVIDSEGKVLAWNNAIEELTGIKAEDMIGKGSYEYALPFYGERRPVLIDLALNADTNIEKRYTTIRKAGNTLIGEAFTPKLPPGDLHLTATASVLHDAAGNVIGAIECIRDNTARKKAERALLASEQRFRDLFNNSPDPCWLIDGHTFVDCNKAAVHILGYKDKSDILNLHPWQISPERQPDGRLSRDKAEELLTSASDKGVQRFEWQHVKSNGETFPVEVTLAPIFVGEKPILYCTWRDITDRKKAELSLIESETKYKTLFESSADAILILDAEPENMGNIISANHAAAEMHRYDLEELLKLKISDLDTPAEALHVPERMRRLLSGKTLNFEADHQRRDGSVFPVEVTANAILISGHRYILAIHRDITERRNAEEQKRALEAKFHQAQKMEAIGTLASGIAHDFNNILTGVQGYASLMMFSLEPDHPHYSRLKNIESQVRSGANLTRQLLGFARGGKFEVHPINLNDLVEKSSAMFSRTRKELIITKNLQEQLWTVNADEGQIEQVLLNLYINASQAMPGGGTLILETGNSHLNEVDVRPHQVAAGKYIRIAVTDTGAGMDEKTKDRIFEPFFTTKEPGYGTGLGLASAYGIVKNHGGFFSVYSEKGKGSSFHIYLPASESKVSSADERKPEVINGSETILVVDDERVNTLVIRELLEMMGYNVLTVNEGQAAINLYREKHSAIDLVILDMIMPGLSGEKVFDEMISINPSVKVILASGYSMDGEVERIIKKGCNGFIQKPFLLNELSARLRQALDEKRTRINQHQNILATS